MNFSMNQLYSSIGISKQAVYQYAHRQINFDLRVSELIQQVDDLRKTHPGCGVEKMYYTLKPDFIGRDRFIELMIQLGYRLKRKKNYRRTTYGSKRYYTNLISGLKVSNASQVWQSDITYIEVSGTFYYIVFIIDVYTKEIVGYNVANNLRATANIKALKMALTKHKAPEIHHSDRGSQYTYIPYVELLRQHKSSISMSGSAQDNAYAERINRTIKEEYLGHWKINNYSQLKKSIKQAVVNYNNRRIHNNIDRMTPVEYHQKINQLEKKKRRKFSIFNNQNKC